MCIFWLFLAVLSKKKKRKVGLTETGKLTKKVIKE